jgi:FHS family L-fucose permease-like MFS transporter
VAILVLILAVLFFFAYVPDVKTEDTYATDSSQTVDESAGHAGKAYNRVVIYLLMVLNVCALGFATYMILDLILPACNVSPATVKQVVPVAAILPVLIAAAILVPIARKITHHNIWAHPHFSSATLSQFFYVAAQAGIFSFFINYVISEMPAISKAMADSWLIHGNAVLRDGAYYVNEKGATRILGYVAFALFCLGRFVGSAVINKKPANQVLGAYAWINAVLCGIVVLKLGWVSVAAVFLSFFFMSVMFPTIFALGIHGLGPQSKKKASAFIVMSITGGALMPKIMGHLGDVYNMSISFWMPLVCFVLIGIYGFTWSKLSQAESLTGVKVGTGH